MPSPSRKESVEENKSKPSPSRIETAKENASNTPPTKGSFENKIKILVKQIVTPTIKI